MSLILFCIAIYLLGGIGASLAYHRVLAHRSARLVKVFEYAVVCIGLPAGTPVQWAGNHRAHHRFADLPGDPHSPVKDGFWYAHCGWYLGTHNPFFCILYALAGPLRMFIDAVIRPRTNQQYNHYAPDIAADPFFAFLSRPVVYHIILWFYLALLVFAAWSGWHLTGILWLWIMLVIVYNLGDSVDSFGHLSGKKKATGHARNNILLGWLSFGDGWHANHHQKPVSARHGTERFQFDLTFVLLLVFKKMGLVSKLY